MAETVLVARIPDNRGMTAVRPARRTSSTPLVTSIRTAYYLGIGLTLLALVTKAHTVVLPMGIAKQIGHNSEALALALAVAVVVEFIRPRWLPTGTRGVSWSLVVLVAAGWLLLALGVYYLGLPSSIKTLNEPFAAAAVLTLWLGPPRPLRHAWLVPAILVVAVLLSSELEFVQAQSEAVTAVVAVSISTDLAARSILWPKARESALTWCWYLFLAVWPAFMLFLNGRNLSGALADSVDYMARGAEGFWGALMICAYFSLLRRAESMDRARR